MDLIKLFSSLLLLGNVGTQILEYSDEFCESDSPSQDPSKIRPTVRVVDEVTKVPTIVLGKGGLRYYVLEPSLADYAIIECSSPLGPVGWKYKGRGATSGIKVKNVRWSDSKDKRIPKCFTSVLFITNITEQLTGKYYCRHMDGAGKEEYFRIFVPSPGRIFEPLGSTMNVTLLNNYSKTIPCMKTQSRLNDTISLIKVSNQDTDSINERLNDQFGVRFDPFKGFIISPTSPVMKKKEAWVFLECKYDSDETSILRINVTRKSVEKKTPNVKLVKSSTPSFYWTTKYQPDIIVKPKTVDHVLWQQYYTENDFETDIHSNSSAVYFLGSVQIMNEKSGSQGQVELKMPKNTSSESHTWDFTIIDRLSEQDLDLKYQPIGEEGFFTCTSSDSKNLNITLVERNIEGEILLEYSNDTVTNITKCQDDAGENCVMLKTNALFGSVTCRSGDVQDTIHYSLFPVHNRPFFVERGQEIVVPLFEADGKTSRLIPCIINHPLAKVYIYELNQSNTQITRQLWPVESESTEIVPKFIPEKGLIVPNEKIFFENEQTSFLCTSSTNVEDRTDAVIVKFEANGIYLNPPTLQIYGSPPFHLRWESNDQLEVISQNELDAVVSEKEISKRDKISNSKYGKEIIVNKEMYRHGEQLVVALAKRGFWNQLHNWTLNFVDSRVEEKAGLTLLDSADSFNTEKKLQFECHSKSPKPPEIDYIFCENSESCSLMYNCVEKNCHPEESEQSSEHSLNPEWSICPSDEKFRLGCRRLLLEVTKLDGFINVSCRGDGVDESQNVTLISIPDESIPIPEQDDSYLIVSPSSYQNPEIEVRDIKSNLDWQLGDTVLFYCGGSSQIFSNGIKWAVETKSGHLIPQLDSIFDPHFKYLEGWNVMSSFNLQIDSFQIKSMWCYIPYKDSLHKFKSLSYPIYIRTEVDEYCEESSRINLISLYPPPSSVDYNLEDTRLDDKNYFVIPQNTTQIGIKVSGRKPMEWIFAGYGDSPSNKPSTQSERISTEFYDASTYCYINKMLLNLKDKNNDDTGRYVARRVDDHSIFSSIYLFVPRSQPPYLVRSGQTVNETWDEALHGNKNSYYLQCLVNHPGITVKLLKKNSKGAYELLHDSKDKMSTKDSFTYTYDPVIGFQINPGSKGVIGTYKCVSESGEPDSLIVKVMQEKGNKGVFKHEKVGKFNVFSCISSSNIAPKLEYNSVDDDPTQGASPSHEIRDCSGPCKILMTQKNIGTVTCIGDGVNETMTLPTKPDTKLIVPRSKLGLKYLEDKGLWQCQANSHDAPTLNAIGCRRPNECELMRNLLSKGGDKTMTTYSSCGTGCAQLNATYRRHPDGSPLWFGIFVHCKGEDVNIYSQYFNFNGKLLPTTIKTIADLKAVRMDLISVRTSGNEVEALFRCFVNRYFYSKGIKWALQYKNGAFEFQKASVIEILETEVQHLPLLMSEVSLDFHKQHVQAVWCFAPHLTNSGWTNSSISAPFNKVGVYLNTKNAGILKRLTDQRS